MNKSVYDKTIKKLGNSVNERLVANAEDFQKLVSKLSWVSQKKFNKNMTAICKIKEVQTFYKPAYVGMCILDLSKTLMYDFKTKIWS